MSPCVQTVTDFRWVQCLWQLWASLDLGVLPLQVKTDAAEVRDGSSISAKGGRNRLQRYHDRPQSDADAVGPSGSNPSASDVETPNLERPKRGLKTDATDLDVTADEIELALALPSTKSQH